MAQTASMPMIDRAGSDATKIAATLVREARSLMAHEVLEGRLNIGQRLDIRDDDGALVHSLDFKDALRFQGED